MLSRACKVAPQASFLAGNADFERLACFAGDIADAPMISFTLAVRKKIWSKLRNTLPQQFFDSLCVAHVSLPQR